MVTFGTAQIHYQEKMVTLVRLRRNTNGTVYAAGQIRKFLVVYIYADSYITRKNGNVGKTENTLARKMVTFGTARVHYQKYW